MPCVLNAIDVASECHSTILHLMSTFHPSVCPRLSLRRSAYFSTAVLHKLTALHANKAAACWHAYLVSKQQTSACSTPKVMRRLRSIQGLPLTMPHATPWRSLFSFLLFTAKVCMQHTKGHAKATHCHAAVQVERHA